MREPGPMATRPPRGRTFASGWLLFLLSLGSFAYFYQAGGWNANTRFNLVRALVEQHSLSIDAYHENTGDKALREGHYYSDKAPGVSLLSVPLYALVHTIWGAQSETAHYQALASYLCVLWSISLPSALAVVALFRLLDSLGLSHPWPPLLASGYALATLAWPYSTLFYGHQAAAAWVLLGFSALSRSRLESRALSKTGSFGVGLSLGLAVLTEYTAGLSVLAVVVYAACAVGGRRRLVWAAVGAALPIGTLVAYHWAAFGGPFTLPYSFSTQAPRHAGIFMGLGLPSPRALRYLLIDEYRGLFFSAPWLLLGLVGIGFLAVARRTRPEALVSAFLVAAYVAVAGSLTDWHGGWAFGPRHLVAVLPFLVLGVGGVGLRLSGADAVDTRPARKALASVVLAATGLGIAFSFFMMLVGTSVRPEVPRAVERPFAEYLFPAFFADELAVNTGSINAYTGRGRTQRFAWNIGQKLGLEGRASLLPLLGFVMLLGGLAARVGSRYPATPPSKARPLLAVLTLEDQR